jgi:cytochrome c
MAGTAALVLLISFAPGLRAQTDSVAATAGVYTAAQSDRGDTVYRTQCVRCHDPSEHDNPDFRLEWQGKTARRLFDYIRRSMPDDTPGVLTQQQYLDVTAYIFKVNGMPPGNAELVADTTVLGQIVLSMAARDSATAVVHHDSTGVARRQRFLLRAFGTLLH